MSNHGSIKKLNWKDPVISAPVVKATSHVERAASYNRHGTPPTRGNNVLQTPLAPESLPDLILNKAVLTPVKFNPQTGKKQVPRKRDSSGKFAESQTAGVQSTAAEDQEQRDREQKMRTAKQHNMLLASAMRSKQAVGIPTWEMKKPAGVKKGVPGADKAIPAEKTNDTNASVVGTTGTGLNIFDDPYYSDHDDFSPDDEAEAAALNRYLAEQADNDQDTMRYANNATTHDERRKDAQSPSDRFMESMNNMESNNNDSLSNFLTPGAEDQNKPLGVSPLTGPKPGMKHSETGTGMGPSTDISQRPQDTAMNMMDAQEEEHPDLQQDLSMMEQLISQIIDQKLEEREMPEDLPEVPEQSASERVTNQVMPSNSAAAEAPMTHAGAPDMMDFPDRSDMPANRMSGVPGHLGGNPNHTSGGQFSPDDDDMATSQTVSVGEGAVPHDEGDSDEAGQGPGSDSYQRKLYESQQRALKAIQKYM